MGKSGGGEVERRGEKASGEEKEEDKDSVGAGLKGGGSGLKGGGGSGHTHYRRERNGKSFPSSLLFPLLPCSTPSPRFSSAAHIGLGRSSQPCRTTRRPLTGIRITVPTRRSAASAANFPRSRLLLDLAPADEAAGEDKRSHAGAEEAARDRGGISSRLEGGRRQSMRIRWRIG
eukprot:261272-Hanusia_phi.AAC.2